MSSNHAYAIHVPDEIISQLRLGVPTISESKSPLVNLRSGGSESKTRDLRSGGSESKTRDLRSGGSESKTRDLRSGGSESKTRDLLSGGSGKVILVAPPADHQAKPMVEVAINDVATKESMVDEESNVNVFSEGEPLTKFDVEFYRQKWKEIHTQAARVNKGKISHMGFCQWMHRIPEQLPCIICRNHATQYLRDHPPEEALQLTLQAKSGGDNAFRWSWKFHNEVNERKGKLIMPYDEAAAQHGL